LEIQQPASGSHAKRFFKKIRGRWDRAIYRPVHILERCGYASKSVLEIIR